MIRKKKAQEPADSPEEQATETAQDETSETQEETLDELRDRLQRSVAELQNFRRQAEKRQDEMRRFVRKDLFYQLLPIVDNFSAAMLALDKGQDVENVMYGVKMINEMFLKLLADNKVEAVDAAVGSVFDPTIHEAVQRDESGECAPDTIVAEIQKGYSLDGLVIRHARVAVAVDAVKETTDAEQSADTAQESNDAESTEAESTDAESKPEE